MTLWLPTPCQWRSQSANPRSFYECDQCHYQYDIQRTRWTGVLEDRRVVRAVAALLLLACTAAGGAVFGRLGLAHGFYQLVDFYPQHPHVWGGRLRWAGRARLLGGWQPEPSALAIPQPQPQPQP